MLGLFQRYQGDEWHLHLLCQITEAEMRGWVAFLSTTPSVKDTARSAGTIATYARSARAFCHWAVRNGYLERLPIVRGTMPKAGRKRIHLIEPEEFERLLLACRAAGESEVSAERAAARNRAILWVFMDTGMRVGELCGLRLGDVDREQRALRVQSTGGGERWLTLSLNGWDQVLSYLELYRPGGRAKGGCVQDDHLFLYGLPTSSGCQGQHIVGLGSDESRGTVLAFLQGAQTSVSTRLMEHMGQKLIKGKCMSHDPSEG